MDGGNALTPISVTARGNRKAAGLGVVMLFLAAVPGAATAPAQDGAAPRLGDAAGGRLLSSSHPPAPARPATAARRSGHPGAGDLSVASARARASAQSRHLASDHPLTRADLARMVLQVLGISPRVAGTGSAEGDRALPFIVTAWRLGFLKTDGSGSLHPDAAVTATDLSSVVGALSRSGVSDVARRVKAMARSVAGDAISRLSARRAASAFQPEQASALARTARRVTVDGHTFPVQAQWTMRATAYSRSEPGIGERTASGVRVREGIVAVDPSIIPLGSLLYVQGYGFALAADTGGAIRGSRIDLYMEGPRSRVERFGVRPRRVYLIAGPK